MLTIMFIIFQSAFLSIATAQPVFAQTPEANVVNGKYLKSVETTFTFDEENQFLKMNIGPSLIQRLSTGEESHFSIPVYGVEEGDNVGSYVVFAHGDVAN
jgi:hypothetical protein